MKDDLMDKKIKKRCKSLKFTMEQYLAYLINKDINGIKNLNEGFYYNDNTEKVLNELHEDVQLTKTQLKILLILLDNKNRVIPSDEIIRSIWKKGNASIFTLRNMIKQIRDKTYYEIIRSHSNKGYSINENINDGSME